MIKQSDTPKIQNRGRHTIRLTRKQIGILKAALQFYLLDDEFERSVWATLPGAGVGPSDWEYMWRGLEILGKLNLASKRKIKEDFGRWGNIERIIKLCDGVYRSAVRQGKRENKAMMEEFDPQIEINKNK